MALSLFANQVPVLLWRLFEKGLSFTTGRMPCIYDLQSTFLTVISLHLSYFPHFTDEASMAQRGQGSGTKSHSQSEAKWTDSQTSAIGARCFPTPLRLPPHSTVASFNAGIPALGTLWVLRFLAEF